MQNNHITHFPNHVNTLPYLVIYHNGKNHILDVAKSQNNTHFITNNSSSVKTNVQSWTRLDRFPVTRIHIPNIDKQTHIHDVTKSQNNTHFTTNNSFSVKTIAAQLKQK